MGANRHERQSAGRSDSIEASTAQRPTAIAIVGMSGRFPKSRDLDALWRNLSAGLDCVGEVDGSRWDKGYHVEGSHSQDRVYTRAGGFLDRIDEFDAEFFGMSPKEARHVDPQHRLLLELTWEALESAGLRPSKLAGTKTGVFVGISSNDYGALAGLEANAYTNIGSAMSIAANRISYVFDLHGPSLSIDTACSSSLVALHQAVQSLVAGSCDAAVVGGVNILASPRPFIGFAQASMLSPDGRCKSFDADGKGYVRAEGGGVVLLKPLANAERDGDEILAVILATGANSDGRTMGMALPSGEAQERLLRQVYADCGVAPEDVFYLEAHGTGTAAGDPIECNAIARVLGAPRREGEVCLIGSVKSNIGHLESGAGMAGLIKVLLAIKHREIPANLHFNTPNPKIDFEAGRLQVVAAPVALPDREAPLIFGVNSFGFGGANAHVVLREHRVAQVGASGEGAELLLLSARSPQALDGLAKAHAERLRELPAGEWAGWRATAARLRDRHAHAIALKASSPLEAADRLERLLAGETVAGAARLRAAGAGKIAFVFSGNGPQWWGMGRELFAANPAFREEIEAIEAIFAPLAGWSLIETMQLPREKVDIDKTEIAQPLLFAQQIALVAALRKAGVRPQLSFGHSVGEAAAAHVSGALSRAQATQVIFHRSRAQATTAGKGRMAALSIGTEEAAALIAEMGGWIEIAAVNAPRAVTVAGEAERLQELCDRLSDEGKFARMLPLNYAFHTAAMDPIEADLRSHLAALRPTASAIPFVSTVEGQAIAGEALDANYWWRNIRMPVRFSDGVRAALREHQIDVFLEIGPHPVLRDYVLQAAKAENATVAALPSLRRPSEGKPASDVESLDTAVASAFAAGAGDVEAIFPRPARPAALPAYAWNRSRFWRGGWALPDAEPPVGREHVLLGARRPGGDGVWSHTLQRVHVGYLNDHVVQGAPLFPAAGYIEMALAAGALIHAQEAIEVEGFEILKPLVLADGAEPLLQTTLESADGSISIRSRPDLEARDWTDHVRGRISRIDDDEPRASFDLTALAGATPLVVEAAEHYADCERRSLSYGPHFQGVSRVRLTPADAERRVALGEIHLPALEGRLEGYHAHPALLDSCLQVLITLIAQNEPRDCATIPVRVGRIRKFAALPAKIVCRVALKHENARTGVADIDVMDEQGRLLAQLLDARFQKVEFRSGALPILAEDWRPDPKWVPRMVDCEGAPAPAEVVARARSAIDALAADRAAYDAEVAPRIDALIGAYAVRALQTLAGAERPFSIASLAREGAVADAALLARLVAFAEADGYLECHGAGDARVCAWKAQAPEPEALRRALLLDQPGASAELVAIRRAGDQLLARLGGELRAPEMAMREALEDTAPSRMPYNRIAAELVRACVAAWPRGRAVRLVEVEGGTGGLAASVLPTLPPERCDYLFADPSEQAAARAKNRFSNHYFVRVAAFGAAAIEETGFDIALTAADVDPAQLFRLTAPGGLVLVVAANGDRMSQLFSSGAASNVGARLQAAGFEAPTAVSDETAAGGKPTHTLYVARRPKAPAPALRRETASPAPARHVLVVGPDEAKTAFVAALARALQRAGQAVVVRPLDPAALSDDSLTGLVAEAAGASHYVHLAGFAASPAVADLARQDLRCLSAIQLARAIELQPGTEHGENRLTIVTRGAFASPGGAGPIDPFQASVAGVARVIANEQPTIGCRLIDIHAEANDAAAGETLADALLARDEETEVLLVQGRRYVHRARASSAAEQARIAGATKRSPEAAFRLDFLPQGGLDSLHLREISRRAPEAGEVEIRIRAAGLNFRDVLWTMGMLPEDAVEKGFSGPTIGMECAGEVVRVGAGVTSLAPGDRVIAFASSCFASHVTTEAGSVAKAPPGISLEAAATLPTAFVTAWYAFDHLARLEPGETVLIHGAAGGVGLAALQIAKLKGAKVIATAGAPDKQKLALTMGADHVLSSRSLKFADDVMRLTDGEGVDVVLNSLAGEAITKGLQILKPFGRFLEIGKRDLYANSRIGLRPFRENLSYFGIDADTLLVERPRLARKVFDEVIAAMSRGDLHPLPYQVIPISRAAEAFRAMQQSRHIGKLVIGLDLEPQAALAVVPSGRGILRAEATYLVTGGLSGFGLATAEWLVAEGARSLALIGRRGDTTQEAQAGLARMRKAGADVRAFALDIADRPALERALGEIRATMPALKGVIHSAALIEDAPLMKLDRDLLHRVMSAKMSGAWNLHEATLQDDLDSFVLYSSSSATIGNPGQGAYVAANAFLNALAEYRRARGLPALAVGWGAIKDAGFLTRNRGVEDILESRAGMAATPARVALAELGRMMACGACNVAAAQFNMIRLGQSLAGARAPRLSKLMPEGVALQDSGADSMADALAAMSEEERRAALLARVSEHVARVVGAAVSQIEPSRALSELGLDSLMAVELAEALEQTVGRPVSVMQMLQAGTVSGVVEVVNRGFARTGERGAGAASGRIAA